VPANLAEFARLLLQRSVATGTGSAQGSWIITADCCFQIRHGDHGIKVKQLHQIKASFDCENVLRFQVEIQIARVVDVF
jgi:hypothetical protein